MTHAEFVEAVRALLADLDTPAQPEQPLVVTIPSGGDIHAALSRPGAILELEPNGTYAGFMVSRAVRINCNGAHIHGEGVPAIHVVPGPTSTDIAITHPVCSSTFQVPIQLGDNGPTQVRLEDVPRRITLVQPVVMAHNHAQAKNAIENNAAEVTIVDPVIQDVYNPADVESHGIVTINTPGGLLVKGGIVDGASTGLFTGGDPIDIPDTDIADITYDGVTVTRSEALLAGHNYNYKNLIEAKNATRLKVLRCKLSNNCGPIQKGFAVVLTPKVDGRIVDVEFNDNDIWNVGSGFNILGRNPTGADPTRTDDIRILNNRITIDKNAFGPGAFGWPFLLSGGVGRVLIEGNTIVHNGNSFVYVDDLERIASLRIIGNTFNAGTYGIKTPAGNNGTNWQQVFDHLEVTGNRISGASSVFKKSFPDNEWTS